MPSTHKTEREKDKRLLDKQQSDRKSMRLNPIKLSAKQRSPQPHRINIYVKVSWMAELCAGKLRS